ncbi:MAG: hypothetical protein QOD63_71 [Actinomycetota bacterium]|nr:hypothetical protein [Actinomycetota bacterium]
MTANANPPSPDQVDALAAQLNRLRRMEATNPVYREMLAAAQARALDGPPLVTAHHWGEYGACGNPAKRPKASRTGADGLTRAEREAAIDSGEIQLTRSS